MTDVYRQTMQPWPGIARYARTVTLSNGLCLFVYDTGGQDAPVTLLVHGLGDEADTWRHVIEPLAQRQRVIALDLPGFGRSDKPRCAYRIDFFAQTLLALLDTLSIAQATLIGSSLGGIIAHVMAIAHRERVRGLVLVDGGLSMRPQRIDLGMMLRLLPLYGEWSYNRLRRDPQAAYETLRAYYADLDSLPDLDRNFLFQRVNERVWSNAQRNAYLSVLRHLSSWMLRNTSAMKVKLGQLTTPTLVVWGEQDHIVPMDNAQGLVAAQPGARLVAIAKAGHLPHQEQPCAFLQALAGFPLA